MIRDPFKIGFSEYKIATDERSTCYSSSCTGCRNYIVPSGGQYGSNYAKGRFIEETIPFLEDEGIHLLNASLGGVSNEILANRIREAQQMVLLCDISR